MKHSREENINRFGKVKRLLENPEFEEAILIMIEDHFEADTEAALNHTGSRPDDIVYRDDDLSRYLILRLRELLEKEVIEKMRKKYGLTKEKKMQ